MNIFTIILFGSAWGFLEATLGGLLHLVKFPFTGQIMGSIAVFFMMCSLKSGLKPRHLVILSFIAAAFKFIDPILFNLPFFDISVINPAQAILMEGLSFALTVHLFKLSEGKIFKDVLASIFTVGVWVSLFNGISYFVLTHRIMSKVSLNVLFGVILTFVALRLFRYASSRVTFNVTWFQPVYVKAILFLVFLVLSIVSRSVLA